MRAKCQCGEEFNVPDGGRAKCPKCGKEAQAQADDWLGALDADELSLDKEDEPEPVAPTPPTTAPTAAAPAAPPAGVPAPTPRVPGAAAPVPPQGAGDAAPTGLWGLLALAKDEPKAAVPHLAAGIRNTGFMIQTGVALLVLALLGAGATAWVLQPTNFEVGKMLGLLAWLLTESVCAAIVFSLFCILLKREAKPLGAVQGIAVVRIVALAFTAPVLIAVGIALAVTLGAEGGIPEIVMALARWVPGFYRLTVFAVQAALAVGLLKMGCWPPVLMNFVVCYGAATLADKVAAIF